MIPVWLLFNDGCRPASIVDIFDYSVIHELNLSNAKFIYTQLSRELFNKLESSLITLESSLIQFKKGLIEFESTPIQ